MREQGIANREQGISVIPIWVLAMVGVFRIPFYDLSLAIAEKVYFRKLYILINSFYGL
jgi:hypothetical protein